MPACFKKTEVEFGLLTDAEMLLMVEIGIRAGICHKIHQYAKANNKYMGDYNQNKESLYLMHWNPNNLYGLAVLQKLLVDGFKWANDKCNFDEKFIKSYDENDDNRYLSMLSILSIYLIYGVI